MNVAPEAERNFARYLNNYVELPFEREMEKYRRLRISEVVSGLGELSSFDVLDVGIGLEPVSRHLAGRPKSLTLVEPIAALLENDRNRHIGDESAHFAGTIENFPRTMVPESGFGLVLLSSVLHEAPSPSKMLESVRSVMKTNGFLVVVVPNRYSIHRILGVQLGVLESLDAPTTTEILMEQNAAYSRETLSSLLRSSGFREMKSFTHFLKPFTHSQLQSALENQLISSIDLESCARLGTLMEDFGSEIISISSKI